MAAISDYFIHDKSLYPEKGLEFYDFKDSEKVSFVQDCLIPFREAYISEEKLTHIVSCFSKTRQDTISERLPPKGMVMSGDFGEILCFYLASQMWVPTANVLPLKWRFKDSKKDASKYTDVILFSLQDENQPSTSDAMFTYEVKTCATRLGEDVYKIHSRPAYRSYKDGKKKCTILEAVFDANKDAVERAAETIPYLLTRCEDEALYDLHKRIDRFKNADKMTYRKDYNAVAVVDRNTLSEQIARMPDDLLTKHPNVKTVYCVPIDNLQSIYENIYDGMRKHAK